MGMYATARLIYGILEDDSNTALFDFIQEQEEQVNVQEKTENADDPEEEDEENGMDEDEEDDPEFEYMHEGLRKKHNVAFDTIYAYDEHFRAIIAFSASASGKVFGMTEIGADKMNADAMLDYRKNILRLLEALHVENYTQYEPKLYLIADFG